MTGFMLTCF